MAAGPGLTDEVRGLSAATPDLLLWVESSLRHLADPGRRAATSYYFPSGIEILGVSAPRIREVVRDLHRTTRGREPSRIMELALALKETGIHEIRQVAYELLDRRRDARSLLGIREIRALGTGNDNWASVDAFSVLISGQVWREGQIPDREILGWTVSRDRWWRRASLVSTVPLNLPSRGGSGDVARTLRVCQRLAGDNDPMVAKALSWALRTLVRVETGAVGAFLASHQDVLPALVLREVRTKLETGRKTKRR